MNEEKKRAKDRDRKRWKYHFEKAISLGLIPHVLMSEQEIRDIIIEHKKARGKPIIPDGEKGENEPHESTQGTTVGEFYEIKKSWEKEADRQWEGELYESGSGRAEAPNSHKRERIEAGESSLIFDIGVHRVIPFPSDSDKHLKPRRNQEKKKEKSSWSF